MKKTLIGFITVMSLLISTPFTAYAQSEKTSLLIGSFTPGQGKMYPVAVAIGDFVGKRSNMNFTIKSYSGPTALIQAVVTNRVQLASSAKADTAAYAYYGEETFSGKPQKSIRAVITVANLQQTWVTLPNNGIKTISDLKGKKLPRYTSMPNEWADALLAVYGIDYKKDVETIPLPNSNACYNEIWMGRLVAAHGNPDHGGVLALKEKAGRVVVLPIPPEKLAEAAAKYPEVFRGSYTGYIRPGQIPWIELDEPVPVMECAHSVYSNTSVPDEVVYTYVKVLLEEWKEVKTLVDALKIFTPQLFQRPLPVPYHPGAVKAYKEKGMWTEEMEKAHQLGLKYSN